MQDRASGGAIRVLIAARAPDAVAGLEKLAGYSDVVSLVGFARYPYELDEDLESLQPDLILLHPDFADLDTEDLVAALVERSPGLRVMVLLTPALAPRRERLVAAGATTVPADAVDVELVAAIHAAVGRRPALTLVEPPQEAGRPEWPSPETAAEPWAIEPAPSGGPPEGGLRWPGQPSSAEPVSSAGPTDETPAAEAPAEEVPAAEASAEESAPFPEPAEAAPPLPEPPAESPAAAAELAGEVGGPEWEAPAFEEPADTGAAAQPQPEAGAVQAEAPEPTATRLDSIPVFPEVVTEPTVPVEAGPEPARPPVQPPAGPPPAPAGQAPLVEEVPVFDLDTAAFEAPPALAPGPPPLADIEPIQPVRPRPARRTVGRADLVVVFSGKGGVGKSLVATNLAVALAADGSRVAVVDLDLQFGDVAMMLHTEGHPTAIDALAQQGEQVDSEFIEQVMATGPEGVHVLLAPSSPEFADLVNTASLRAILRELTKSFDHVVVDTPAHLEERNLEAIEMADQIIVVSSFSLAAIKDTKVTLKLLQSLGIAKERLCVVLNQTRVKANFPRSEVEENLRFRVVTVLPFEPRVDDAIDNGRPFITVEPKSEFSKQFQVLVDHIGGASVNPLAGEAERGRPRSNRRRFSLGRS